MVTKAATSVAHCLGWEGRHGVAGCTTRSMRIEQGCYQYEPSKQLANLTTNDFRQILEPPLSLLSTTSTKVVGLSHLQYSSILLEGRWHSFGVRQEGLGKGISPDDGVIW